MSTPVRWHPVRLKPERPNGVEVECLSTEHNGKLFAAGVVYVRLAYRWGRERRAVACRAGKERTITTEQHAPDWLTYHGLPVETARALVTDTLAKATGKE